MNCEDVEVETVESVTTIRWQPSKMIVTSYMVKIYEDFFVIFQKRITNVNNRINSIDIFGLNYNTKFVWKFFLKKFTHFLFNWEKNNNFQRYGFEIQVFNKNISSKSCFTEIETGDPC